MSGRHAAVGLMAVLFAGCGPDVPVEFQIVGQGASDDGLLVRVDGQIVERDVPLRFLFDSYEDVQAHVFTVVSWSGSALLDRLEIEGGICAMCFCPDGAVHSASNLELERLDVRMELDGTLVWDYFHCTFTNGACGGP